MTLKEIDQSYVLSSYARNYTNFVRGKGAKLYCSDDDEYIDFSAGIGVSSVGHDNPILVNAISNQVSRLIHISNLQVIEPQAQLAQAIVELSGYDMRCFFGNSGAEANEAAVKIAKKHGATAFDNKRYKIVTLENSFHGRTISTAKATAQESIHPPHFAPYPDGFVYASSVEKIYDYIDEQTVAVMIELIQGEGGVEPLDKVQVQALAKKLKNDGILLIVDEVQTGVYRTGKFLASQLYEIEPDIITLAKGLGGGVPIGVAMTSLKDIFSPGDHGSTFGGNYLSSAAGLAVLSVLQKAYDSGSIAKNIEIFDKKLTELASAYPALFSSHVGIGLMLGLRATSSDIQQSIIEHARENRLLVLKAGRDTVRFLPPLTITMDEITEGFERFEKAISSI